MQTRRAEPRVSAQAEPGPTKVYFSNVTPSTVFRYTACASLTFRDEARFSARRDARIGVMNQLELQVPPEIG